MKENLKVQYGYIDVLIVINVEYIKENYPRNTDPQKPQRIDHNSNSMISHNPREIALGQGTANLNLKAKQGDYLWFRATTIQQNSECAVVLYKMEHGSGNRIFKSFEDSVTGINAVQFNEKSYSSIPPLFKKQFFTSYSAQIYFEGTEDVFVYFALYILNSNGDTHELYGYYYLDPQFVVQFIK